MNKLSRFSLASLVSLAAFGAPGALLFACATDNGDSVHGPQFGPLPERPDGSQAEGAIGDEGGPVVATDAEAGSDAPAADADVPACTAGTVAVLAGNDTSLSAAVRIKGGAWTGAAVAGGAAKSAPSLVAFGTGFTGLTRGSGDALQSVTYGTSWSGATSVGALVTLSTPALTVMGAKAEAVYRSAGTDINKFSRIENAGVSWGTSDPVMASGGAQAFGLAAATIAAVGTELVFAQDGTDEGLYVQTWNATSWGPSAAITGAGTISSASPALAAVSGKFDLVLLYPDNTANHVIGFATRDAMTKTWSTGQVTQPTAQTAEQMSVATLSATALLVAFRGNNGRPYTMLGTIGASAITWGLPAPLLADTSTVDSAPAVAPGVCGNDAIAVFASGGIVKATESKGATWSVPGTVTGAAGSRVSVATR